VYAELEGRAQEALDGEGFDRDSQRMQRTADLRYVGQAFEVRVPVADGELDRAAAEDVAQAFHAAHRQLYGYDFATDPRQAVEWVNLRVSGIGPIRRPDIVELPLRDGGTDRAVTGSRRVFFDAEHTAPSSGGGWIDTPTYNRPDLAPGDVVTGPAIIEEFGSTVPVHPGFAVTVDAYGNLLLTKESAL
jgi:N-methylhydantoinase A